MKTLDEVITMHEHCTSVDGCDYCPYAEEPDCMIQEDALYYLKMYRSDMQMYSEDMKYWENELKQKIKDFGDAKERYIKRLKELDIGTLNEPLTWDELKQMEGKPVWVENFDAIIGGLRGWISCKWMLVDFINDFYMDARNSDGEQYNFDKDEQGNTWQAYRKERV